MDDSNIYLDYNATTPLDRNVETSICLALSEFWANPSSNYEKARKAKSAITEARGVVANLINAPGSDIFFVSGGTEANMMVIDSVMKHFNKWKLSHENNYSHVKPHIITTSVEHDAIQFPLTKKYFNEVDVTFLGWQDLLETVVQNIKPTTCLITVMLANNETGILLPVGKIGRLLLDINERRKVDGLLPVFLHTDAAQAIGKIPVDVCDLNVDYLTIVGHKFYGPRIGALYVRSQGIKAPLYPIFFGGGQERGMRSGTENTPMIVGLGKAAAVSNEDLGKFNNAMQKVRNYLEQRLKEKFSNLVKINCVEQCNLTSPDHCGKQNTSKSLVQSSIERLPNTTSVSFNYEEVTGAEILQRCQILEASTGSACHSSDHPKSVLEACGVCPFHAMRTIRLSVGRENTLEEMDLVVKDIANAVSTIVPADKLLKQS